MLLEFKLCSLGGVRTCGRVVGSLVELLRIFKLKERAL